MSNIHSNSEVNQYYHPCKKMEFSDFPGGSGVKKPPADAGDTSRIPGPGRFRML